MSLYSDGIIFKFRFQKSRFTPKNRDRPDIYLPQCMNSNGYPFKASIVFKRDPVQTMMGNSNQLVVTNLLCSPY